MRAWAETAPYTAGIAPERHFLCAPGWMLNVGLRPDRARSYSCTVSAPLNAASRRAMAETYWMFFSDLEHRVSSGDWDQTLGLVRPESPDFLPAAESFCATITYVVFKGARCCACDIK